MKPHVGRILLSFLVLAGLAGALGGCSLLPGNQVVARVGKSVLTRAQFQVMLGEAAGGPSPPDSMRRAMLVDDWVNRTLLVTEALASRMDTVSGLAEQLREQLDQTIAAELYKRAVLDKSKPGEADMKALYAKRAESRRVAHIATALEGVANEAKKAIDGGMPFEEVAKRFSMDTRTSQVGGEVPGEFAIGDLPEELEGPVFALKPGQVTAPVAFQGGFEVLKLLSARPAKREPYEQMKPRLREMLGKRLQAEHTKAFVAELKKKRKFVVESADVKRFVDQVTATPGDTLPTFTPTQLSLPLARFEGGPYTVGDMLRDTRRTGLMTRPNFADANMITLYIDNGATYTMLVAEGRSRGLHRDAQVAEKVGQLRAQALSRAMMAQVLSVRPHPSEDELRAGYQARRGEFVNGGLAEATQIVTPVASDAEAAARQARANMPFHTLVKQYSRPTAAEARTEGMVRVIFDGTRPALEDSLRNRLGGQIVGPVAYGGRYYVFQVQNVAPPMSISFDEARMRLMQEMSRENQMRTLREHLEGLKKRWPPTIHTKTMLAAKPAKPARPAGGE